jgi:kynurenine formamidase
MPASARFRELARKLCNWGRWGPEDELGTLNFLTPEVVRAAAHGVRSGRGFSLAAPLQLDGLQTGLIRGRLNPLRTMTAINEPMGRDVDSARFSDDVVVLGLQAGTHWDALAHVSFDGSLYNGFPADSVDATGARRCGIERVRALAGRGVLLDVARARGVPRLALDAVVTPADLDAALAAGRLEPRRGDIALVRTGQMQLLRAGKRAEYGAPAPGLALECAQWFHEREVAAVATDTLPFEQMPPSERAVALPLHVLHLVQMGLMQGQNFDLEELAEACAQDGRYDFFLEASPEPFACAVGSPVNPIAIR